MAVALVQQASTTTTPWVTDGTGVVTFGGNATVGNTIVVLFGIAANMTVSSVTDTGSNTYATDANATNVNGNPSEVWAYWAPVTSATNEVTTTFTAASGQPGFMWIGEFSGLDTADLFEMAVTPVDTTATTTHDIGPITTTVADSLLIGGQSGSNGTYTNESGWTEVANWAGGTEAYKILSSTTSTESWNPTSAANEDTAMILVALNGTGGGGGVTIRSLALLGVGN